MKINKSYKFRIYPNKEQEILINKTFGCTRLIFNLMLNERKINNNPKPKYLTEKQYKEKYEFLKEVDSIALQQSRINLEQAYKNYFNSKNGKRKGKEIGEPNFKSKHNKNKSYRTQHVSNNIQINFENSKIKLPKLGWIKYSDSRIFKGDICNVTISKVLSGKYFVAILIEEEIYYETHKINSSSKCIGLDYDSKNLFTNNENQVAGYPRFYRKYENKLKKAQRKLSKKKLGSKNREKQRIKLAKIHEKIANSRKDFQDKLSTQIVKEYDVIGIESLNMQAMSQCLNLGKSTLDNAWGYFRNMLEYKSLWYGKHLIFADKWYASTKTCSYCGYKLAKIELSTKEWECPICHTQHYRDQNAAINLMNNAKEVLKINTSGTEEFQAPGDRTSTKLEKVEASFINEGRNLLLQG